MSKKKKILAIINPKSGTRSKEDIPSVIHEVLDELPFQVEIKFTEYAGHGSSLAQQAVKEKIDYVISVGGDGTCNEIAKELIHTDTALAIVPIGSGNGLARHLGIPLDIRKALKLLTLENVVCLDYGKANDEVFFCTCGVGFDALVSLKFSEDKHRGGLTYIRKVITEYLRYKYETYELVSDNGTLKEKAFLIACGNASQYGNNAYIAPQANMQDGLMDITIVRPFSPLEAAPLTLQLFTRQLNKNSNIRTFEKKEITIIRKKPGIMHIDGEPVEMNARITVRCIPHGLNVVVPKETEDRKSLIQPLQDVLLNLVNNVKEELGIK